MHVLALLPIGLALSGCAAPTPEARPERQCLPYESMYDGIDGDCNGGNDFDSDGDGYVVDRVRNEDGRYVDGLALAQVYAFSHGLSLDLRGGDCDDFDPDIHPGAVGDVPYDGIDTDCDGANDFDADGDGWIPAGHSTDLSRYVTIWLDGMANFPILEGDCDDADPTRHPDAVDLPYDGVDHDCDRRNEFDQDGDGFIAAGFASAYALHGDPDQIPAVVGFGDCDDQSSRVHPAAVESSITPRDEDCDGEAHAPVLSVLDVTLTNADRGSLAHALNFQSLAIGADGLNGDGQPGAYLLSWTPSPERLEPVFTVRLTEARPELLTASDEGSNLSVAVVEAEQSARISVLDWAGSPVPENWSYTPGVVGGTALVSTEVGDLACGQGPSTWLHDHSHGPAVDFCGVLDAWPVYCDDGCWADTDRGPESLPWTQPQRIEHGLAFEDGRLVAADGSEPWPITFADDATGEWIYAAFIVDGEVYISEPTGTWGPLRAETMDWMIHSETRESVGFYADEVHIGVVWGQLTVFALDHTGSETRIAMARIDP